MMRLLALGSRRGCTAAANASAAAARTRRGGLAAATKAAGAAAGAAAPPGSSVEWQRRHLHHRWQQPPQVFSIQQLAHDGRRRRSSCCRPLVRGLCSNPSPNNKQQAQAEAEREKEYRKKRGAGAAVVTKLLHIDPRETVWTAPNLITMSRIAASPLLSWAIWAGHYDYAVCGLAVAAATDWLDGYIAKSYNQTSVLGGFLDPLADKVLVACLSVPLAMQGHLPMPLLVVVFGRDALLMAGSFLKRASERPEGSAFFDTTSSATFQITPNLLSKSNTVLQFTVLTLALSRALWDAPSPDVFEPLCWLTGATTVGSGLSYLVGDGTKVLSLRKHKKKDKGSDDEPPAPPSA